jgi:exodeoxyribonuclease VII small subunit
MTKTGPEKTVPADMTFEKALERLEAIVGEMESGRLSLDNALQRFEEGSALAAFCSAKLDEAERKIELLVKKENGNVERRPFEEADETDDTTGEDDADEEAEGDSDESLF